MSLDMGVWVAGLVTLAILSHVWKENPFYRIAEHLYVGISAGHAVVMAWGNIRDTAVKPLTEEGQFLWIVPIVLGILLYARYFKGISWIARFPVAVMVGIGTGVAVSGAIHGDFSQQISATIKVGSVNEILLLVFVIASLSYFFFSRDLKGPLSSVPQLGKVVLMVAFGAAFGTTVMGRMALLIGRIQFILGDWLGVMK
ncbi:MAG TPA: hypothetical protein GX729_07025 [Firmicutes bacterium]|jgi:hypothetical protein|nr:hypothetical protein [Bacillota bacterium]